MEYVCCNECGKKIKRYRSHIRKNNYCSVKCSAKNTYIQKGQQLSKKTQFVRGEKPHNYKGWQLTKSRETGRYYKLIHMPSHPNATKGGYVREHRLVMERVLGRLLHDDEVVDHINRFDTLNNDPSNLRIMKKKDHDRMNTPLNIHKRWVDRGNSKP